MPILILLFVYVFFIVRWSKQDVADFYAVSRKTLDKWVRYFSRFNYKVWRRIRKLSPSQLHLLLSDFGFPYEAKVMTKAMLIDECYASYKSLVGMVEKRANQLGFGLIAYHAVDKFPPRVGSQLVKIME